MNSAYLLPEHLETIPMFQAKKEFATEDTESTEDFLLISL